MPAARRRNSESVHARRRRDAVKAMRREAKADAFLISRPEDISWLTGFTGEDSLALIGAMWAVLITDSRYAEQAGEECSGTEVLVRTQNVLPEIVEQLSQRKAGTLGIQSMHLTARTYQMLGKEIGRKSIASISDVIRKLRAVKDTAEIKAIRRSIAVAQDAMGDLLSQGRSAFVGRTEQELAAELDYRMRQRGAAGSAFETIVAAGENGSRPHYRPGARTIEPNDPVLIDWGALVEGYCSDLTRVVFTGTIRPELADIYQVVLRAQKAAIAAIKSGVACKTVDAAARSVIDDAGYGEAFGHGLGHGIGREIHERPHVAGRVDERLRSGMIFTVEPGVYLPGIGGVRIEDDVLVTAKGKRVLSSLPKDIEAMKLG
ncbi:MAG: M24 family metallopeptidase [Planctomycetota bacterium]